MTTSKEIDTEKSEEDSDENLDDPISDLIGEYGKWQFKITFLISLCSFPATFHMFLPTFTAYTQNFWCARPAHLKSANVQAWKIYSQQADGCQILNLNWYTVKVSDLDDRPPLADYVPCNSWEFDTTIIETTTISDWNLVCDREYLRIFTAFCFLFGCGLGGAISGMISDRFGRKKTLVIAATVQALLGIIMGVNRVFELHLLCKVLLGFASVSAIFSSLVLAMEIVGGKWCVIVGVYIFYPLPIGYILVSLVSMVICDWRNLQLIFSIPCLLFFFYWWLIPESPRWLLLMGRMDQLRDVIKQAADYNNIAIPESIDSILKPLGFNKNDEEPRANFLDLFRGKYKKITVFAFIATATTPLLYYGLVLNNSRFPGNLHHVTIMAAAIEIPAGLLCLYILLNYGRRLPICISIVLSGLGCLALAISDEYVKSEWLGIFFVVFSRFCICATNNAVSYYTAELYPTLMRNMGVGSCQISAGVSLISLPYLWTLQYPYPLVVMGIVGAVGGLCVLSLPETFVKKQIDKSPSMTQEDSALSQHSFIPENLAAPRVTSFQKKPAKPKETTVPKTSAVPNNLAKIKDSPVSNEKTTNLRDPAVSKDSDNKKRSVATKAKAPPKPKSDKINDSLTANSSGATKDNMPKESTARKKTATPKDPNASHDTSSPKNLSASKVSSTPKYSTDSTDPSGSVRHPKKPPSPVPKNYT